MLTFELSAIDVILSISVIVLLLLYTTKSPLKFLEKKSFFKSIKKSGKKEKETSTVQTGYAECPRGFGNIKKIGSDNSVSERCLGCYRIMDCYQER